MFIKASRFHGIGLALLAAGIAAFTACSSDDTTPSNTAGTGNTQAGAGNGMAGTPGAGGTPGAAGSNSAAGTPAGGAAAGGAATGGAAAGGAAMGGAGGGSGFACAGKKPTSALITSFEDSMPNAMSAGQFAHTLGIPGGTFTYKMPIKADVSGKNLNVKGNVATYAGFGVYFTDCWDAAGAGATGVSFKIKGKPGMTGMVTFKVQTNGNHGPANMKGTCNRMGLPADDDFNSCHDATFDIPVTDTETEVSVTWDKLTMGMPNATVNGKDVIGFEWAFNWVDMTTMEYDVDVTVDDIKWTGTITGGGGMGGAGGMGGMGGSSAGMGGGGAGGMGGTGGTP